MTSHDYVVVTLELKSVPVLLPDIVVVIFRTFRSEPFDQYGCLCTVSGHFLGCEPGRHSCMVDVYERVETYISSQWRRAG